MSLFFVRLTQLSLFTNYSDATIWPESLGNRSEKINHQNFSEHEKQFVYLPLAVLDSATNIRQLFSHIEDEKKLIGLIRKIHTQMSSKRWVPELINLRFIDTASVAGLNEKTNEAAAAANVHDKPQRRLTRSASLMSTSKMERSPKQKPANENRPLRKRKVKN